MQGPIATCWFDLDDRAAASVFWQAPGEFVPVALNQWSYS